MRWIGVNSTIGIICDYGGIDMTPHIEAKNGDYAEIVLMPGDPLRAKYIAETFLENVICVNKVRGCLGYTGVYNGSRISVQASGMGQPSLGIYAYELYNFYDVESIIRVGSCGGLSSSLTIGDIVVAMSASTDSNMTNSQIGDFSISPVCNYELLRRYTDIDSNAVVGSIISSDYFYNPKDNWAKLASDSCILGVDMETHLLYALSMKFNKKALSVNTVSDHLLTDRHMTSKERETGLSKMIVNVLRSIT